MSSSDGLDAQAVSPFKRVVINSEPGGFCLSAAAVRRWAELSGVEVQEEGNRWGDMEFSASHTPRTTPEALTAMNARGRIFDPARDIARDDPMLIRVIEELGEAANGQYATLKIVEIPADADWYVDERMGGVEAAREQHQTWE
ncbi:MAG: hypothetical protein ACOY58_02340 [Candidatus Micrarchaeota archaeon]